MANTILDIAGLRKAYGQNEVLKGVDCAVREGEVISIIGSSGSGKTTLLRCINMLEEFEGGTIRLDGEEIGYHVEGGQRRRKSEGHRPPARANRHGLPAVQSVPHMSAAENVMLGLIKVKKLDKAQARAIAGQWLERVGGGARQPLPRPALRRPAAARGHRPRHRHGAQADAVRRSDLGAGPRTGGRGAAGHQGAGGRRHDHAAGHARNALRLRSIVPRHLHEPGRHLRRRRPQGDVRAPPTERLAEFLKSSSFS